MSHFLTFARNSDPEHCAMWPSVHSNSNRSESETRIRISMTPSLIKAAGTYAKRTGRTLSGLIADSLMEKIKRRAS